MKRENEYRKKLEAKHNMDKNKKYMNEWKITQRN